MPFKLNRDDSENSLHEQLVRGLSAEFALLPPETRLPSAPELKERFNVAYMTVTRALDELADRGEIVRIRGRGSFTANRKLDTVYVLTPCPSTVWNKDTSVLDGAMEEARKLGITVRSIYATLSNNPPDIHIPSLERIPEGAAVVVPGQWYCHLFEWLKQRRCHVAYIDDDCVGCAYIERRYPEWHRIMPPRARTAAEAVRVLKNSGRKRILLLHHSTMHMDAVPRGFREGLAAVNLPFDPRLEIHLWGDLLRIQSELHMLYLDEVKFDAMVTQSALYALAAVEMMLSHGIRVPEDVAVVSLQDSPLLATCAVPVSAFDPNRPGTGMTAVRILASTSAAPVRTTVDFKFFKRKSI